MVIVKEPDPVICRLTSESLSDLYEIELDSDPKPWSKRAFAKQVNSSTNCIYGLRLDGRLLGFVLIQFVSGEAHIMKFGIRQEQRRRGLGKTLLREALLDLHSEGCRQVTLEVRVSNSAAITLYQALGFYEAGIRKEYYTDNQEDALVLQSDLREIASARITKLAGNE